MGETSSDTKSSSIITDQYVIASRSDFIDVADAIRAKRGTSDALAFPGGFVDAIGAIETGGSNTDRETLKSLTESTIVDLVVPEYATKIGQNAFRESPTLKSVTLLSNITKIESGAFLKCTELETVSIAEGLTYIGASCFNSCYALKNITLPNTLGDIGASSFMDCRALEEITIPKGLQILRGTTFSGCSSLKTVTFLGKPNQFIPATGFTMFNNKCTALTDVYVPWAEGEVANAPWGAPETVTIHYNHTEEGA